MVYETTLRIPKYEIEGNDDWKDEENDDVEENVRDCVRKNFGEIARQNLTKYFYNRRFFDKQVHVFYSTCLLMMRVISL